MVGVLGVGPVLFLTHARGVGRSPPRCCSAIVRALSFWRDQCRKSTLCVSCSFCCALFTVASLSLGLHLEQQAKVLVVSAGCAGGALYGFYLVDGLERARKEALKAAPPVAVPNLPEHLRPALEGRSTAPGKDPSN